jgi:hypothetical protein
MVQALEKVWRDGYGPASGSRLWLFDDGLTRHRLCLRDVDLQCSEHEIDITAS